MHVLTSACSLYNMFVQNDQLRMIHCCSEGLDYVISQAQAYGIKLILTLTNYYVSS